MLAGAGPRRTAAGGGTFFAGGPDNDRATAAQIVDISGFAGSVDDGVAQITLSALIGGWEYQEDRGTVAAIFLDMTGRELGGLRIGPVTASQRNFSSRLLPRQASRTLPARTRTIRVVMTATRFSGPYNDGYFDNIMLSLRRLR